jgi:hypothetical protein
MFAGMLRDATAASSARAALKALVANSFDLRLPAQRLLFEAVQRCDFEGQKTEVAAAALNMSVRQFFRLRNEAMEAIALSVDHALGIPDDAGATQLHLAELVAEFDPSAALEIYNRYPQLAPGRPSYERAVAAIWAGEPAEGYVEACSGPWRMMAQTVLIRYLLASARQDEADALTESVRREVEGYVGPLRHSIEFELAEIDRRSALRRGRTAQAARLAGLMCSLAKRDSRLNALAQIASAESAISGGDFGAATTRLAEAEGIGARARDVSVLSRAEYARACIAAVKGDHAAAASLFRLSASAIEGLDGGFALRAHMYEGRAALLASAPWSSVGRVRRARGSDWVNAEAAAVQARYQVLSDPRGAVETSAKALEMAQRACAPGALAYGSATLGIALDASGDAAGARNLFIDALKTALDLNDRMLLWDLFDHPSTLQRDLGPLAVDNELVEVIGRAADSKVASRTSVVPPATRALKIELTRLALVGAAQQQVELVEFHACCKSVALTLFASPYPVEQVMQVGRQRWQLESAAAQWLVPASQRAAFGSAYQVLWERMLERIHAEIRWTRRAG